MKAEDRAILEIAKTRPGLIKSGMRTSFRKGLEWLRSVDPRHNYVGMTENHTWDRPPFVPDATRWRTGYDPEKPGFYTVTIEVWEVEDTNPLSSEKFDAMTHWSFWLIDAYATYPGFEIWRSDRRGKAQAMLYSHDKEVLGIETDFPEIPADQMPPIQKAHVWTAKMPRTTEQFDEGQQVWQGRWESESDDPDMVKLKGKRRFGNGYTGEWINGEEIKWKPDKVNEDFAMKLNLERGYHGCEFSI
jgi:hypothetical protein